MTILTNWDSAQVVAMYAMFQRQRPASVTFVSEDRSKYVSFVRQLRFSNLCSRHAYPNQNLQPVFDMVTLIVCFAYGRVLRYPKYHDDAVLLIRDQEFDVHRLTNMTFAPFYAIYWVCDSMICRENPIINKFELSEVVEHSGFVRNMPEDDYLVVTSLALILAGREWYSSVRLLHVDFTRKIWIVDDSRSRLNVIKSFCRPYVLDRTIEILNRAARSEANSAEESPRKSRKRCDPRLENPRKRCR